MFHLFLDQFFQRLKSPFLSFPPAIKITAPKTLKRFDDGPTLVPWSRCRNEPSDLPDKLQTMLKTFEPIENVLNRPF